MKQSSPEFVSVGIVLGPWGNQGKFKVHVLTDFPERFAPAAVVYINRHPYTVDDCLWHKGKAIIKLDTVDSIEDIQSLHGQLIEIHHSQLKPLAEGGFYHFQLIGLEVWTTGREKLGHVIEILTPQSNDVYVVHGAKGEILIPAIEDVVKSIDIEEGRIIIEPMKGLLD